MPRPVTLVVDASGVVSRRFEEEDYRQRRTGGSVLAALAGPVEEGEERRTEHFTLRVSSSNESAAPGQRVSLLLDFEMRPGRHAYAPGAHRYRALAPRLDPQPLLTVHEPVYPPSRPFTFKPLDETVPVFEGRFRVIQDVTVAVRREVNERLEQPDASVPITGRLDYQVCSETICYPPSSLLVGWTLRLKPLDRERAGPRSRPTP